MQKSPDSINEINHLSSLLSEYASDIATHSNYLAKCESEVTQAKRRLESIEYKHADTLSKLVAYAIK